MQHTLSKISAYMINYNTTFRQSLPIANQQFFIEFSEFTAVIAVRAADLSKSKPWSYNIDCTAHTWTDAVFIMPYSEWMTINKLYILQI